MNATNNQTNIQCQHCKNMFKNIITIRKHQISASYCLKIQQTYYDMNNIICDVCCNKHPTHTCKLFDACLQGNLNIVKELISNKYINVKNKYGFTALMWAIRKGHIDIEGGKELIKHVIQLMEEDIKKYGGNIVIKTEPDIATRSYEEIKNDELKVQIE